MIESGLWLDILTVSLWGGLVASDTTAALQIMISHPLVSCAVVGFLLGNFPLGFAVGIILELVWLNELPVGAAPFSEGNIGATVAAATAVVLFEQTGRQSPSMALALICGVFISIVGGHVVIFMRHVNSKLYSNLLNCKNLTDRRVRQTHLFGIFLLFINGFLLTAASLFLFAYFLLPKVLYYIPGSWDKILEPVSVSFFGVGCGVLLYMFYKREKWWLLIVGVLGGIGFAAFM